MWGSWGQDREWTPQLQHRRMPPESFWGLEVCHLLPPFLVPHPGGGGRKKSGSYCLPYSNSLIISSHQQDSEVGEVITLAHCLIFRLIHQDAPSCGPVTKTTCTVDLFNMWYNQSRNQGPLHNLLSAVGSQKLQDVSEPFSTSCKNTTCSGQINSILIS